MQNFMKKISYTLAGTGMLLAAVPVMAEPAENVPTEQCCAVADVDSCLNIREGAGTDAAIIGKLPKDGSVMWRAQRRMVLYQLRGDDRVCVQPVSGHAGHQ